jgi:hypothetical protein
MTEKFDKGANDDGDNAFDFKAINDRINTTGVIKGKSVIGNENLIKCG